MFSPIENYKFAWFQALAPSLGFLITEQISFHLSFSQPMSWHIIRGENNQKCLIGISSTGNLPDGDNRGSSNKSLTQQQHYLSSCLHKLQYCTQLPKHVHTERYSSHPLQRNPLVALGYMSSDPTVVSPRKVSKSSLHFLRVLMLRQDIRSALFLVHS